MSKPSLYARRAAVGLACLASALVAAPMPAAAQAPPCAACLVPELTAGQALLLPDRLAGLEVLVRTTAGRERDALPAIERIDERGGHAGVVVEGTAAALEGALLARVRTVLVDLTGSPERDAPLVFALRKQLTALRASAPAAVRFGVAAPAAVLEPVAVELAPYLDFLVVDGVLKGNALPTWQIVAAPDASAALAVTRTGVAERWVWRMPADAVTVSAGLRDLAAAAAWLPAGLIPSPDVTVQCAGRPAEAFLNPLTLETTALAAQCREGDPIVVTPPGGQVERVTLSAGHTLLRLPAAGAPDRFAEGVQVVAARQLSVEEIIARHQAAAARQAAAIRQLISTGTLTITFEAPGFTAPVTIGSETVIYAGGGQTDLEQRNLRINGIAFTMGGVPRLPIIEPERASSPPLAITLTDVYRYRLAGEDTVAGTRCYVVEFQPTDAAATLFRGRAWIAADSFAMVKVAATQTGLRGAIVSSEQIDEFRAERPGLWLLARSETRQLYEGAAHRTPITRVLVLARHEINPSDFVGRRAAAYASSHLMLRDTPEGYRYLKKSPPAAPGQPAAEPVVAGRSDRVRTLAGGVIIDPNISTPLPFAGLSYVDFNLFGTGAQLNAFFGGSYGQGAFSVPSLGGSRWQLAGRAFGIASSYNDRSFVEGKERYEHNIRQRPAHASVWLLRPLTTRISIRAGYEIDYTHLARGSGTAATFVVPQSQLNHGARLALDLQRGGWAASLWWNPARRQGWRAWGPAGGSEYSPAHRDFQRFGATVTRSIIVNPRVVTKLEGAWMDGRDLDRFSRYSFGTFDNRLRGYPSALIRYDRGGVLRGSIAWAAGRLLRIDGFLDSALVRDPGFGRRYRNYTGTGAALEAPAPFGMLLALEWGYGFRGVNTDGREGTHVLRVSAFKIF